MRDSSSNVRKPNKPLSCCCKPQRKSSSLKRTLSGMDSRRQGIKIDDLLNPLDESHKSTHEIAHPSSALIRKNDIQCDQGDIMKIEIKYEEENVVKAMASNPPNPCHCKDCLGTPSTDREDSNIDSSVNSNDGTVNGPARCREFRPPYDVEQVDFVWFFKVDRRENWSLVETRFNAQWPGYHRGKGGLQCKLYRYTKKKGVPDIRQRLLSPEDSLEYGMWKTRGIRYSWMDPYADELPGF